VADQAEVVFQLLVVGEGKQVVGEAVAGVGVIGQAFAYPFGDIGIDARAPHAVVVAEGAVVRDLLSVPLIPAGE